MLTTTHCTSAGILRPFLERAATSLSLRQFSSSSPSQARKDGNRKRGTSALHGRVANKDRLKFGKNPTIEFPKPVLDPEKRSKIEIDADHGLWGFFKDKQPLLTPEALSSHGRAWTVAELRKKDYLDLWKLYWTCCKEINTIYTHEGERERMKAGYSEAEALERLKVVKATQRSIRNTLRERYYQFENARELAMSDPEVDLYANPENGELAYKTADSMAQPESTPAPTPSPTPA